MKIKFLATGKAPDKYEFEGERVFIDDIEYDLSSFEEGDVLEIVEGEDNYIRAIERKNGELYVTLCQESPVGHWRGIDEWVDSANYNPSELYIRRISEEELALEMQQKQAEQTEESTTNVGILKIKKAKDV